VPDRNGKSSVVARNGSSPTDFAEEGESHTCTQELAEMLRRKVLERLGNVLLDRNGRLLRVSWAVRDNCGGKIRGINGIVYTDCDLERGSTVNDATRDTSPHRL
jgi:hypothetical protein